MYHKEYVDRMDADSQGEVVDQAMYAVEASEEREFAEGVDLLSKVILDH